MGNLTSSIRVRFETLRRLGFASIDLVNYTAVGAAFDNPVRILKIANHTNQDLIVSLDGVNDNDIVAGRGYFLYDFSANRASQAGFLELPAGNRVYVRGDAVLPTTGEVFATVLYASQV